MRSGTIGKAVPRLDGVAKVTGAARYGDDHRVPGAAHAALALSTIARGTIVAIDQAAARAVPGVLEIFTHENVGRRVKAGRALTAGGYTSSRVQPLASPKIYFAGQIVALVVAESAEAAREAADRLAFTYDEQPATASFDSPGATTRSTRSMLAKTRIKVGDPEAAFATAAHEIDARYETPAQHHNPMELFQVICVWDGDDLTVWESTQHVIGTQRGIAKQLGISPKRVRVIATFVGGGFGARNMPPSTPLVAFAARVVSRPVRLVATRQQGFTLMTFRAETRHRVRLAADRDGRFVALNHDSWELTSRTEKFILAGSENTARLYACPNIRTEARVVEADRQTPGFMRAPPEVPYFFAMESAVDELAHAMDLDPIELRRRNDTPVESVGGKPFSSRALMECFDTAAESFGWRQRAARPRSMRQGEWWVGYGCAAAAYPAQIAAADCRATLFPDDCALIEIGTHDIGTGAYTILAQTAADRLGLPIERIEVRLGDSRLPAAPLTAGSVSTASNCNAVAQACEALAKKRKAQAARTEPLVAKATFKPHGAMPFSQFLIRRGIPMFARAVRAGHAFFSSGAHFVEAHVHVETAEVRVPRMVGAFAAGTIVNPLTARSQLTGGQIWGLSAALHEATEIDRRTARYVNRDLAGYHVPVHADIGRIETILLPQHDEKVNPLGIKGIGELGNTGVNAAVANAVFHATAIRCRSLPIRVEHLLRAPT
ncbi:MAG: xanthine dehydrogenase family protein molybdopterin-binding subunit [Proteobacteria bacterium]|nr:xanthine dehydrogenase family protein molybdopterin-binding subunit [Pseudomonadota bacterium]